MVDQRKAPECHYNVPTHILETIEICRRLLFSSLLHHSNGYPPFRTLFACQTQRNLCKRYVILRINPWQKSLSITAAISVTGAINSVLNGWSWQTKGSTVYEQQ